MISRIAVTVAVSLLCATLSLLAFDRFRASPPPAESHHISGENRTTAVLLPNGDIEFADGVTCEDVLRIEGGFMQDNAGRWLQRPFGPVAPATLKFASMHDSVFYDSYGRLCHTWEMRCRAVLCLAGDARDGHCVSYASPDSDDCTCDQ